MGVRTGVWPVTLVFEVACCVPTHDFWAKNGGDLLVTVGLLFRNHAVGAKLGFCDSTSGSCLTCVLC